MAKKGTIGGPRAQKSRTAEEVERSKQYRSRKEQEQRFQRMILFTVGTLIVISVVLLIGAVVYQEVIEPRQSITTVNGDGISTNDYQARVRAVRWLTARQIIEGYYYLGGDADLVQQYLGDQIASLQRPAVIGAQVIDEMEEELILKQAAKDLGITIDNSQVDQEVEDYMASYWGLTHPDRPTATPTTEPTAAPTRLVPPTATAIPTEAPTVTPAPAEVDEDGNPLPTHTPTIEPTITLTPTPAPTLEPAQIVATIAKEEDRFFDDGTDTADVDKDVIRDIFFYDALRVAVRDKLAEDLPTEEFRVDARHMLFAFHPENVGDPTPPTEEQKAAALARAEAAMAALQDGEPFAELARELSDDTGSGANGGELGWATPDTYVPEFADAVTNGDIGAIIGPVETQFGYHLIQVHERGDQPLTESEINTQANSNYEDWLSTQKASADIERREDWRDRVPEEPTYNELMGELAL